MPDLWKNDKQFKEAIGSFIIAFSEMEFGLALLCTLTEFDLRLKDSYIAKYLGLSFEQKTRHLTEFIDEHLPEIKPIWDLLKVEISHLNKERRFFVHGFMSYSLPRETITTHIREKGQIVSKKHSIEDINSFTNILHHLKTGENGINGEFNELFTKTRINQWNKLVNEESKIVYRVNGKAISDWKG